MILGGNSIKKYKFNIILLFTIIFSILLINTVYAEDSINNDTIFSENYDPDDFNSIQNLIDDASSGDSISLDEKTYFGNGSSINIDKDLTIKGSDAILNATGKSNIFNIAKNAKVNLIGLTLTNGYTSSDGCAINNEGILNIYNLTIVKNKAFGGGAIRVSSGGELNAFNTKFESNNASVGAAIDNFEGYVTINNCSFISNYCNEGGIYNRYGECYIYDSLFVNNSAQRGGGVYNNKGNMRIYRSQFYGNYAGHLGGAIKSFGNCFVSDSIIKNNTGYQGGGLFVSQNRLWVSNCIVENNNAFQGGGFFADVGGLLKIRNTDIINNSAEEGGGIRLYDGILDIQNSRLINNSAVTAGGAVFYCDDYTSDIKNLVFENNHAKIAGAIYVGELTVKITNASFTNNYATNEGGAIYNKGNLSLNEMTFNSNSANDGGAIYSTDYLTVKNAVADINIASNKGGVIYSASKLDIENFNFQSNEANYGGSVFTDGDATVKNAVFTSNKASQGGAIYSNSDLGIDNCEFIKNQIIHTYGTIFIAGGNSNITNSLFKSNRGSDEGGCIFILNAVVNINNSQFLSNTAKSYGAAINNDGELTVANSLFDKNQAWSAAAIDNGGKLTILFSNFTNNKATLDGGAVINKGNLTIIGSVFENNLANGEGGAILAKRGMNITHSIIYNNYDGNGYAIFNKTWDVISLSNNWWGLNSPDFEKLLNINISDDFKWIIMSFTNSTPLIQHRSSNISVTFDNLINSNNTIYKLDSVELLAKFRLNLSLNNYNSIIVNGSFANSFTLPILDYISSQVNGQIISLNIIPNPYIIVGNKNIAEDYSGKTTFKARITDSFGVGVSNVNVVLKISGKIYNVKTDKTGGFAKTFSLTPGKYTIYITCEGKTVKNTINIHNVLKAKNAVKKKSKKIKYTASLKTSNGQAIAGKKITFKIKGKTYSAKTNKKGVASVKFKNLKVGKYKIALSYLNSQLKTILKVKK